MLILLPPSEGKESPVSSGPLALPQLSFPVLTDTRVAVTDALVRLCDGPAAKARATLSISIRQDEELERNRRLLSAPTAPAGEIYSGVLYDALDLGTLGARARGRAAKDLAIASALFGLVRVNDHIPAYRLSADTVLPGVGRLSAAWRDVVSVALVEAAGRGIVIDMRSSAYVSLGPVPAALADRTAVIRVLQDRGGRRVERIRRVFRAGPDDAVGSGDRAKGFVHGEVGIEAIESGSAGFFYEADGAGEQAAIGRTFAVVEAVIR